MLLPLPGSPGAGDVCRARHLDCQPGLRVYRDARDRWAASRKIWNQHAYHIVNVEEDGTIPRTSQAQKNWLTPGLNNFRMNGQGDLMDVPRPDLTVGNLRAFCEQVGTTRLSAEVCNRGTALSDFGIEVIFRKAGGEELCRLRTDEPVPPGFCHPFSCVAPVEAEGEFEAVVDPDGTVLECHEAIVDAIEAGDAEAAAQAMHRDLLAAMEFARNEGSGILDEPVRWTRTDS